MKIILWKSEQPVGVFHIHTGQAENDTQKDAEREVDHHAQTQPEADLTQDITRLGATLQSTEGSLVGLGLALGDNGEDESQQGQADRAREDQTQQTPLEGLTGHLVLQRLIDGIGRTEIVLKIGSGGFVSLGGVHGAAGRAEVLVVIQLTTAILTKHYVILL